MNRENHTYQSYLKILEEELVPAMGCTEPIALAYAAARCRDILGTVPEKIVVKASGSIIKNVKSVIVPNTGDHHAKVRITNQHTNIVREEKDGRILFEVPVLQKARKDFAIPTERISEASC